MIDRIEIPKHWEVMKLENLIDVAIGGDWGKDLNHSDDSFDLAYCIRGSEMKNWDEEKGSTASLRKVKKSSIENRKLQEGDILVEISGGGPEQPVGRTVLIDKTVLNYEPSIPKICTNFLRLIRPTQVVHSKFLNLYLKFFYRSGEIVKYQGGSNNLRNLKFPDFIKIGIPIPPLSNQETIVSKIEELFSEVDKGIEEIKNAQQQLKVYRQSILKTAFEGTLTEEWRSQQINLISSKELVKRIKNEQEEQFEKFGKKLKAVPNVTPEELCELETLPDSWSWCRLGDTVWSVKDGPHYSPKYEKEGIPFISGGNIRPEGINFAKAKFISKELHEELSLRCKPQVNDVLYTKGGTTGIARVNTYDIDFNVWVHVAVLKPVKSILPFYLQHVLNSNHCYKQSQKYTHGVGNQDLGLTRMVLITLPICSLEEQQQIVQEIESRLSVCDKIEETITNSLKQAEALRQSILKKAFEGKLI